MENQINITVITLAAYYDMVCKEKAVERVLFTDDEDWEGNIMRLAWNIMDSATIHVRQHVSINNDDILVVLDTNEITDDIINESIELIKTVIDTGKTYFEFGPIKSYRSYEVVNLLEKANYKKQLKRTLYSNFEILQ